jgi:predicted solute-binding protein
LASSINNLELKNNRGIRVAGAVGNIIIAASCANFKLHIILAATTKSVSTIVMLLLILNEELRRCSKNFVRFKAIQWQ